MYQREISQGIYIHRAEEDNLIRTDISMVSKSVSKLMERIELAHSLLREWSSIWVNQYWLATVRFSFTPVFPLIKNLLKCAIIQIDLYRYLPVRKK